MSAPNPFHLSQRAISVLNGAVGGRLDAAGLGRPTTAHAYPGAPPWSNEPIIAALAQRPGRELTILVHGLMGDDLAWRRGDDDLGHHLLQQHGSLPVYLRYNSGLDLQSCARRIDGWLAAIEPTLPASTTLSLVCHSLGGLVTLLAMSEREPAWRERVRRVVLLGVPQRGAPLARAAAWTETQVGQVESGWARILTDLWQLRGESIADLAQGLRHRSIRVPEGARLFMGAGILGPAPTESAGALRRLLGDALVNVESATSHLGSASVCVFPNMGHLALMHAPDVWDAISRWWGERESGLGSGAERLHDPLEP